MIGIKAHPVNQLNFRVLAFFIGFLTVLSFFAAWGKDDGTLGQDKTLNFLADLFDVLRFPSHTILWPIMDKIEGAFIAIPFFGGLILNIGLYALIFERMLTFIGVGFQSKFS